MLRWNDISTRDVRQTTNTCRKRQAIVGNDKHLSETTNACRKRQTLVGNGKPLSETANTCRNRQTSFLSLSPWIDTTFYLGERCDNVHILSDPVWNNSFKFDCTLCTVVNYSSRWLLRIRGGSPYTSKLQVEFNIYSIQYYYLVVTLSRPFILPALMINCIATEYCSPSTSTTVPLRS